MIRRSSHSIPLVILASTRGARGEAGGSGLDRLHSIELDFWRLVADQHHISFVTYICTCGLVLYLIVVALLVDASVSSNMEAIAYNVRVVFILNTHTMYVHVHV